MCIASTWKIFLSSVQLVVILPELQCNHVKHRENGVRPPMQKTCVQRPLKCKKYNAAVLRSSITHSNPI